MSAINVSHTNNNNIGIKSSFFEDTNDKFARNNDISFVDTNINNIEGEIKQEQPGKKPIQHYQTPRLIDINDLTNYFGANENVATLQKPIVNNTFDFDNYENKNNDINLNISHNGSLSPPAEHKATKFEPKDIIEFETNSNLPETKTINTTNHSTNQNDNTTTNVAPEFSEHRVLYSCIVTPPPLSLISPTCFNNNGNKNSFNNNELSNNHLNTTNNEEHENDLHYFGAYYEPPDTPWRDRCNTWPLQNFSDIGDTGVANATNTNKHNDNTNQKQFHNHNQSLVGMHRQSNRRPFLPGIAESQGSLDDDPQNDNMTNFGSFSPASSYALGSGEYFNLACGLNNSGDPSSTTTSNYTTNVNINGSYNSNCSIRTPTPLSGYSPNDLKAVDRKTSSSQATNYRNNNVSLIKSSGTNLSSLTLSSTDSIHAHCNNNGRESQDEMYKGLSLSTTNFIGGTESNVLHRQSASTNNLLFLDSSSVRSVDQINKYNDNTKNQSANATNYHTLNNQLSPFADSGYIGVETERHKHTHYLHNQPNMLHSTVIKTDDRVDVLETFNIGMEHSKDELYLPFPTQHEAFILQQDRENAMVRNRQQTMPLANRSPKNYMELGYTLDERPIPPYLSEANDILILNNNYNNSNIHKPLPLLSPEDILLEEERNDFGINLPDIYVPNNPHNKFSLVMDKNKFSGHINNQMPYNSMMKAPTYPNSIQNLININTTTLNTAFTDINKNNNYNPNLLFSNPSPFPLIPAITSTMHNLSLPDSFELTTTFPGHIANTKNMNRPYYKTDKESTPMDQESMHNLNDKHEARDDSHTKTALIPTSVSATTNSAAASRRNAWGNFSYADLITKAIITSPEKRLTLSQIYDWMVQYIPYFKDKGDNNSSAGWKNSIRHNLSLHNRFIRIQNEGAGKSSWWMINPDAKTGKTIRRRAATMDNNTTANAKRSSVLTQNNGNMSNNLKVGPAVLKRGRIRKRTQTIHAASGTSKTTPLNGGPVPTFATNKLLHTHNRFNQSYNNNINDNSMRPPSSTGYPYNNQNFNGYMPNQPSFYTNTNNLVGSGNINTYEQNAKSYMESYANTNGNNPPTAHSKHMHYYNYNDTGNKHFKSLTSNLNHDSRQTGSNKQFLNREPRPTNFKAYNDPSLFPSDSTVPFSYLSENYSLSKTQMNNNSNQNGNLKYHPNQLINTTDKRMTDLSHGSFYMTNENGPNTIYDRSAVTGTCDKTAEAFQYSQHLYEQDTFRGRTSSCIPAFNLKYNNTNNTTNNFGAGNMISNDNVSNSHNMQKLEADIMPNPRVFKNTIAYGGANSIVSLADPNYFNNDNTEHNLRNFSNAQGTSYLASDTEKTNKDNIIHYENNSDLVNTKVMSKPNKQSFDLSGMNQIKDSPYFDNSTLSGIEEFDNATPTLNNFLAATEPQFHNLQQQIVRQYAASVITNGQEVLRKKSLRGEGGTQPLTNVPIIPDSNTMMDYDNKHDKSPFNHINNADNGCNTQKTMIDSTICCNRVTSTSPTSADQNDTSATFDETNSNDNDKSMECMPKTTTTYNMEQYMGQDDLTNDSSIQSNQTVGEYSLLRQTLKKPMNQTYMFNGINPHIQEQIKTTTISENQIHINNNNEHIHQVVSQNNQLYGKNPNTLPIKNEYFGSDAMDSNNTCHLISHNGNNEEDDDNNPITHDVNDEYRLFFQNTNAKNFTCNNQQPQISSAFHIKS